MDKYKKGDIVNAIITNTQSYGVFASFDDDYSGLIHISEITDKYVRDINDYVEVGDEVTIKILEVGKEKNQYKLSMKRVDGANIKKKNKKIKETVFGFYLLKKKLPAWIDEKMKEFDKKS